MSKHIMIPSDLAHVDRSETALAAMAVQAKYYDAKVTYVAIISNAPSAMAHNPEEFAGKLAYFSKEPSARREHRADLKASLLTTFAVDLDKKLAGTVNMIGTSVLMVRTH